MTEPDAPDGPIPNDAARTDLLRRVHDSWRQWTTSATSDQPDAVFAAMDAPTPEVPA